jgi:hypothetical protein
MINRHFVLLESLIFCALVGATLAASAELRTPQTLIAWDAVWKFHDGGQDLGEAWKAPDYDAGAWKSGKALLGYATGENFSAWPAPGLQTRMTAGFGTY